MALPSGRQPNPLIWTLVYKSVSCEETIPYMHTVYVNGSSIVPHELQIGTAVAMLFSDSASDPECSTHSRDALI